MKAQVPAAVIIFISVMSSFDIVRIIRKKAMKRSQLTTTLQINAMSISCLTSRFSKSFGCTWFKMLKQIVLLRLLSKSMIDHLSSGSFSSDLELKMNYVTTEIRHENETNVPRYAYTWNSSKFF